MLKFLAERHTEQNIYAPDLSTRWRGHKNNGLEDRRRKAQSLHKIKPGEKGIFLADRHTGQKNLCPRSIDAGGHKISGWRTGDGKPRVCTK